MLKVLKQIASRFSFTRMKPIPLRWVRRGDDSWLDQNLPKLVAGEARTPQSEKVERLAAMTHELGPQPLWTGYSVKELGPTRLADDVRTSERMGNFYARLVRMRKPHLIVEFGTAFGVSGMYFLSGLDSNGSGILLTFEPNDIWRDIARVNLAAISSRFTLVAGTFEDNISRFMRPGESIDMAFIDAIHKKEFVVPQLDAVVERSTPGAIILLDDIRFSPDMEECWKQVSCDRRFVASAAIGNTVGVLELAGDNRLV